MSVIQCHHCNQPLYALEMKPGVKTRCAMCGVIDYMGGGGSDVVSLKSAWWSMGLGLASIVFLFLSGIPAVILGIRALLKSRYQRVTPWTTRAAIIGIISGGLIGVIVGGCIGSIGAVAAVTIISADKSESPEEAQRMFEELCRFDLPEHVELKCYEARQGVFVPNVVELRDTEELDQSTVRLVIGRYPQFITNAPGSGSQNRINLKQAVQRRIFDRKQNYLEVEETAELKGKVLGKSVPITRTRYSGEFQEESKEQSGETPEKQNLDCIAYECTVETDRMTFFIMAYSRFPDPVLNDTHVQELLASFQPLEQ